MKRVALMMAVTAVLAVAQIRAQTPTAPEGGRIDANDFEHSYKLANGFNFFWDSSDDTNIAACAEAQNTGYAAIGWNAVNDVIMAAAQGNTVTVVDANGHRPSPDAENTINGGAGKAGSTTGKQDGWITFCFTRTWDGGANNEDIIHDGSQNMVIKYAHSSVETTNGPTLAGLDNANHASDGGRGINLADPANPVSNGGGGRRDEGDDGPGNSAGGIGTGGYIGLGVAGAAIAGGLWYKNKNAGNDGHHQHRMGPGAYNKPGFGGHGGPPPGHAAGGPPGYGGPPPNYSSGGYGSGGSRGKGSRGSRSRSRSSGGGRSHGSRGRMNSGSRSRASNR